MSEPSPEVQGLRQRIDALVVGGALDLAQLPVNSTAIAVLGEAVPLQNVTVGVSPDGTTVTLAGGIDIGGGTAADAVASLMPLNGQVYYRLCVDSSHQAMRWQPEQLAPLPFDVQVTAFEFASSPDVAFSMTLGLNIGGDSGDPIAVTLDLPGLDGAWAFETIAAAHPITLSRLVTLVHLSKAPDFPWVFDQVGLAELSLAFVPGTGMTRASCAFVTTESWPLTSDGAVVIKQLRVGIDVDHSSPAQPVVAMNLGGVVSIGRMVLLLTAQRVSTANAAAWTFSATLRNLKLVDLMQDLAAHFGVALDVPAVLRDLVFETIAIESTPTDGSFSCSVDATGKWELPGGICLDTARLRFKRQVVSGKATYPWSVHLEATGGQTTDTAVAGIGISKAILDFSHDGSGWAVSGQVLAQVLGSTAIELDVSASETSGADVLVLQKKAPDKKKGAAQTTAELQILNLPELGASFFAQDLRLTVSRPAATGTQPAAIGLDISAGARLQVRDVANLIGRLEIGAKGLTFSVTAQGKPLTIPIPKGLFAANQQPALSISSASIQFKPGADAWVLTGQATVTATSFPDTVQTVLGKSPIQWNFQLDAKAFSIGLDHLGDPFPISLPRGTLRGTKDTFDPITVALLEPKFEIRTGGDIALSVKPAVTLPASFNRALFGNSADGQPRAIFKTNEPIRTELTIGLLDGSPGATLGLVDLPFHGLETDATGKYWLCDLGSAGLVQIKIPHLNFADGGFAVDGGLTEDKDRPLTIPLTVLKHYLATTVPPLADVLPDGIRVLASPKLLSGSEHLLAVLPDYLEQHFGSVLPDGKVPAWLVDALQALAAAEAHLPDRLKEYLDADPPNDVSFSIKADPSGSLTIDLQTCDPSRKVSAADALTAPERPVMALIPALPVLMGLRLSRLQVGPVFGGSLILLRLNAEIDIFDPVMLAGSIAAAESATLRDWLPDATTAHETLIAHDLMAFIVPEAVVPIPIPLFYAKLGVDACGPAGLAVGASVSFDPLAENTLLSVFKTLSDLYSFVTDPTARLPVAGGIKLDAAIGPTYLQLPRFLGGGIAGRKDHDLVDIDISRIFANVLNGVKFFSLADALAGIPLEDRCGAISPQFGPLSFQVGWAATTRQEFETGLKWSSPATKTPNPLMALTKAERSALAALVAAAPGGAVGDGLVILLAGQAQVGKAFTVAGRFGLVSAGRNGGATAVALSASLANAVAFKIGGQIAFDFTKTGDAAGGFSGHGQLLIGGREALGGQVLVTSGELSFSGQVDLFPGLSAITITSATAVSIKSTGFTASGQATVSLFGLVSSKEQFTIDHQSFSLTVGFQLTGSARAAVTLSATDLSHHERLALTGELDNFSPMLIVEAVSTARQRMVGMLDEWIKWANTGYKKEASLSWWQSLSGEHTELTWTVLYDVFTTLRADLKATSLVAKVLEEALDTLPSFLSSGIRTIRSGAELFTVRSLKLNATMTSALAGQVGVTIELTYAGKPLPKIGPITVSLSAADLAQSLATAVVKHIFGR